MLVPYYDKDGQLQGWVREEQDPAEEWRRRIRAIGTAMLKILALQYELEEPLNLNSDMAADLAEEAIQSLAHLRNEHTDAMRAMSLATKPRILAHKKHWDEDTFWDWIKEFWYAHAVLSPTYNLPNYRRAMERPSRRPAISIMMDEGNVDDLPEESSRKTRPREDDDAEEDAPARKRQLRSRAPKAVPRPATEPVGRVVAKGRGWITIEEESGRRD
ncbi:hypothetical protein B0H13DRAFT_1940866, partial [Mycena leptocephala]